MEIVYILLALYALYLSFIQDPLRHIINFITLFITIIMIIIKPLYFINVIVILFIFYINLIDYKKIRNNEFYYLPLIKIRRNIICVEIIVYIFKYKFTIRLRS